MDNRLTPNDTQPTQTTEQPQSSPFNSAPQQPVEPVQPPVQPQAPVTPPVQETQPVQPVQPIQPPVQPVAPIQQTQNNVQEQPTQPAFVAPQEQVNFASKNPNDVKTDNNQSHPMKAILDAEPKVLVMVPLFPGEKPNSMHPVGINGYFYYLRKGVMLEVPRSIGELVRQSFNLDAVAGEDIDLSKNEDKLNALS